LILLFTARFISISRSLASFVWFFVISWVFCVYNFYFIFLHTHKAKENFVLQSRNRNYETCAINLEWYCCWWPVLQRCWSPFSLSIFPLFYFISDKNIVYIWGRVRERESNNCNSSVLCNCNLKERINYWKIVWNIN
jgi:hypothetical protein